MKSLENIEKSGFHRGEYVGYCGLHVWRTSKYGTTIFKWRAIRQDGETIKKTLYAHSLGSMSIKLSLVNET